MIAPYLEALGHRAGSPGSPGGWRDTDQAVRMLTRRGLRAARLEDGHPEWARAGLSVTSRLN